MELDQYFEEAMAHSDFNGEHKPLLEKWQSDSASVTSCDDNPSGGFDCNICLDSVQDPVVTLCGHLFCWPCIYKWLHNQDQQQQQLQCPVCKAGVSQATLVPLYGRGQTTKTPKDKVPNLGIGIPQRPSGPVCGIETPRPSSNVTYPSATHQFHHRGYPQHHHHLRSYAASSPVISMFGEMVYERVFGNSMSDLYSYPNSYHLAGTNTPRLRRHIMLADKSLSRISFFLFCCVVFCLLLF